ncbi:c-type cytochrome [Ferruginibacter lapsinanis]|uniref:cbb3-type cytochrome c oxidase N-terminal domain-containing protein n=1 Tax=Ferruginibacter lapsinanis TaxID=563172 RepID=UPI001E5F8F03|nr:cbb3-type cytochrome c oxidase N-terminal domain-containing protein [Ferruginibacter lapsinanis]UEG50090.1 c-type cytochrome [Ferruginibacter lapsinanis]
MHFNYLNKKKNILVALALIAANSTMAQDATTTTTSATSTGSNLLATLLIVTAIVLAFVIWGMGQALIALTKQLMDRSKKESKLLSVVLLLGFTLLSQLSFAQQAPAVADVVKEVPNYGGLTAHEYYSFVTVIGIEIAAILFLTFFIRRIYVELFPAPVTAAGKKSSLSAWWDKMDKKLFTKAIPVEQEADIMLDHDYDGIKELDNALPPWWKYGFYFTIVVAVIYLLNFHVIGSGKNPTQEYEAEMDKAKIEKELFDASNKDKIDEANVPMADAAGLKKAKEFFNTDCWACHGKLGEGGAGPNFTDDYWLHKGSLNDVYQSIKHGYPDKGMQSWAVKYNPKEISLLASYIKTLRGTNPPNAKAPQGDLYVEGGVAADSNTVVKADSVSAVKK